MIEALLQPRAVWRCAIGAGLGSLLVLFLDQSYGYPPALGVIVCFLGHVPFFLADDRLTRFGFWLFVTLEAVTVLLLYKAFGDALGWGVRSAAAVAAASGALIGRHWRQHLDGRASSRA